MLTNVRCTPWLHGSGIYWRRCNRWNWWGHSSGAVLDWRRSDIKVTKPPPLYVRVWPAEIGVREASMQAWRKARHASCECKPDWIKRSLWPCHWLFKAWALAKSSTKAWNYLTFPSNLQRLSFDGWFDQSLDWVTLPSSLQILSLGDGFNQSLERVTLPSSLQSLSFGGVFSQSLERVTLPSSLQSFCAVHSSCTVSVSSTSCA